MSFLFRGTTWPATDRRLSELRFMRRTGLVHPDDQPAALGCRIDEDGCYRPAPFTIEDAALWVRKLLDDDSHPVAA